MSYWGHRQENSHLIKGVLKLKKKKKEVIEETWYLEKWRNFLLFKERFVPEDWQDSLGPREDLLKRSFT